MRRVLITLLALGVVVVAEAEESVGVYSARGSARGVLMNRDVMTAADLGELTWSSYQYGTARSMALAGAMTSLGGDASSMMINPAGLGMYRTTEATLTPLAIIQRADTKGGNSFKDGNRGAGGLANFSAVFNLYQSGNGRLVSLNLGLGYNRVRDLNYSYSVGSQAQSSSIANLFSRQLTGNEVSLDQLYGTEKPNWNSPNIETNVWGAVLGYKSGLTFQSYGEAGDYPSSQTEQPVPSPTGTPIWRSSWLLPSALVNQNLMVESDGSVGEYDIAVGGDISNKLYFGFTFGVQSLYQKLDLLYDELYAGNSGNVAGRDLVSSTYNQAIVMSGAGVNLKFGATYRPIEALRIGVAYHSPTWYSVSREYQASVGSASVESGASQGSGAQIFVADSPIVEDRYEDKWRYNSPSRIMVGGSYTFAKRALLTVDYQRDCYGTLKMRSAPIGVGVSLYDDLGDLYKAVNTYKFGGEFKCSPAVALRGGYGFSSSMLRDGADQAALLDQPTTDKVRYFAAGVGYSPSRGVTIDLTYMRYDTEYSEARIFYGTGSVSSYEGYASSARSAQSERFSPKIRQHNIALSMIVRM